MRVLTVGLTSTGIKEKQQEFEDAKVGLGEGVSPDHGDILRRFYKAHLLRCVGQPVSAPSAEGELFKT